MEYFLLSAITFSVLFFVVWIMKDFNEYEGSKYVIKQGVNIKGGFSSYTREWECIKYIDDKTKKEVLNCIKDIEILEQ